MAEGHLLTRGPTTSMTPVLLVLALLFPLSSGFLDTALQDTALQDTALQDTGLQDKPPATSASRTLRDLERTPQQEAERRQALLEIGSRRAAPRFSGERISLSLKDADLVEVLRSFARLSGVNLVVDPRVQGAVTVELHDVPWDQALWVILKSQGLGAQLDGRLWSISPP